MGYLMQHPFVENSAKTIFQVPLHRAQLSLKCERFLMIPGESVSTAGGAGVAGVNRVKVACDVFAF